MYRLAALLAVLVACSSGFETGPATLTGITPAIMSAGANSFTEADGSGNTVLGWKVEFFSNGSGYDCLSNNADEEADLLIFTNQPPGGGKKAMLTEGDISIVPDNPPTATAGEAAHFSIDGVSGVSGDVNITYLHLNSSNTMDRIEGTVTSAGTADAGGNTPVNGMFVAPVCE